MNGGLGAIRDGRGSGLLASVDDARQLSTIDKRVIELLEKLLVEVEAQSVLIAKMGKK